MEYLIYFHEQPSPQRLAAAVSKVYSVPVDQIAIIVNEQPLPGAVARPAVLITHNPHTEVEPVVLEAGDRFAKMTGEQTELEVAAVLCREVRTSAILSGNSLSPNQWILVTREGGHGTVMVDPDESDEGRFRILAAPQPIAGAPEISLA